MVLLSKTPQVAWELLPVALLLLPIALTLYMVRKAQRVQEVNRVALWFSCVRFLRWLVIGTFVAWWASTDLLHWRVRFDLLLAARGFFSLTGAPFAALILFWLPPVLVVCYERDQARKHDDGANTHFRVGHQESIVCSPTGLRLPNLRAF